MGIHRHSLNAKLAAMAVGDVIYLPDDPTPVGGPTRMERNVSTAQHRGPNKGLKFSTTRVDVLTVHRRHEVALKVERLL